jgi:metal-responsive CopG/Arc/MetJ family transcriptional regulator
MNKKFQIEREIYDELAKVAKERGYKTVDDLVAHAVREYVKKLNREA